MGAGRPRKRRTAVGQGCVGAAEGGLSVADRIALVETRQNLAWERALRVQAEVAFEEGDHAALVRAESMIRMGIDNYLDLMDIRIEVESEGTPLAAAN